MSHQSRERGWLTARGLAASLILVGLAACGQQQDATPPEQEAATVPAGEDQASLVENGRAIVEMRCATCHAIGAEGDSPRSDAPPLRTVLADYDPDALADDFREGIHVGHPDMPDFNLGPRGTDSVLAYLVSIQETSSEG